MTKRLKLGSHSFYLKVANCPDGYRGKFDSEIRRLKLEWVSFQVLSQRYRKWDEIGYTSQTTNRKSYMNFGFVEKSMTLNDLGRLKRTFLRVQRSAFISFTKLLVMSHRVE